MMPKFLDAWQDNAAKRLLGLVGPVARVVLLHELGWDLRWCTGTWAKACALRQRILEDPRYAAAAAVITVAARWGQTWTSSVCQWMRSAGIEDIRCCQLARW